MPFATFATVVLSAIGMGLDAQAAREAEAKANARYRSESANAEKWRSREYGLTLDKLAWEKSQAQKKWKWMEEDRSYQRGMDAVNRFTSFLDRDVGLKNRFMNIWGK